MSSRWRDALGRRLPELVLEGASVVFAVLLALAVDQWRDHRADMALARRARSAIVDEVRDNLAELQRVRGDHLEALAGLRASLAKLDAGESEVTLGANFTIALLATSAWQTAQLTRATYHLDYAWIEQVSEIYELQRLYGEMQGEVVRMLSGITGRGDDPQQLGLTLARRIEVVAQVEGSVIEAYRASWRARIRSLPRPRPRPPRPRRIERRHPVREKPT